MLSNASLEKQAINRVDIYSLPSCYRESVDVSVTINGEKLPVIQYTDQYDYCHFSFSGTVTVQIEVAEPICTARISPLVKQIVGTVSDRTLTFELSDSKYLIVKINDYKEVILAAEDWETDVPTVGEAGVFDVTSEPYFADCKGCIDATDAIQNAISDAYARGGGIVYVPDGVFSVRNLVLKSNVSLYLCGGAVLRLADTPAALRKHFTKHGISGKICDYPGTWMISTEAYSDHIRIYGRGTIDANGTHLRTVYQMLTSVVVCHQCSHFSTEGIVIRDGGLWSFLLVRSHDISVTHTKHLNEVDRLYENDAIDVLESQNVTIRHTIAVAEDDTYSLKAYKEGSFEIKLSWVGSPQRNENVLFEDCFAWTRCGAFKIGWGVFSDMKKIVFRNSYVYSCMTGVNMTHYSGTGVASDITYENIDIEAFRPKSERDCRCMWLIADIRDRGEGAGGIRDVNVSNIHVRSHASHPCIFRGYAEDAAIENITLSGIVICGEKQKTERGMNFEEPVQYVKNLTIKGG